MSIYFLLKKKFKVFLWSTGVVGVEKLAFAITALLERETNYEIGATLYQRRSMAER